MKEGNSISKLHLNWRFVILRKRSKWTIVSSSKEWRYCNNNSTTTVTLFCVQLSWYWTVFIDSSGIDFHFGKWSIASICSFFLFFCLAIKVQTVIANIGKSQRFQNARIQSGGVRFGRSRQISVNRSIRFWLFYWKIWSYNWRLLSKGNRGNVMEIHLRLFPAKFCNL